MLVCNSIIHKRIKSLYLFCQSGFSLLLIVLGIWHKKTVSVDRGAKPIWGDGCRCCGPSWCQVFIRETFYQLPRNGGFIQAYQENDLVSTAQHRMMGLIFISHVAKIVANIQTEFEITEWGGSCIISNLQFISLATRKRTSNSLTCSHVSSFNEFVQ